MPVITVKVFEGELTKEQTAEIIADITEAVIPYSAKPSGPMLGSLSKKLRAAPGGSAGMPWDSPISGRSSKAHHRISSPVPDASVPTTEERSNKELCSSRKSGAIP